MPPPTLPSILPSQPAVQDAETTPEQLEAALGLSKVTTPAETAIFICEMPECYRLYPTLERLVGHRRREHGSAGTELVVTWNC
ncbi:hypothetical protein JOM56_006412 [Amanita muscaria]